MAIRQLAPMLQIVGQGNQQAARSNQTYATSPDLAANSAFVEQGQVEVLNSDGSFEVFVQSLGARQHCSSVTDEPLVFGSQVWVSKTKDNEWVIHGSIKD